MSTTLFLGLALSVSAPGLKDPPAKPPTVEGEWTVESGLVGGKPDTQLFKNPIEKIVVANGKWSVHRAGQEPGSAEITFDPKKDPPEFTFPGSRGEGGIYKLEGDTLTICYDLGAGKRPQSFDSPVGSNVRIMVLKRIKPAK
jgi:uncharacterized protein (TIGR03067 family)